jgi:hypothetical protein
VSRGERRDNIPAEYSPAQHSLPSTVDFQSSEVSDRGVSTQM